MSAQYRLVGIGNEELVAGLYRLVQQSNSLTAQVLAHLVELEERQLHLELGFSSLFAYCVEGLGMSEGTAGRRVTAARVCRRFPEVFERVARGELHLCALCALAPHLNEQNSAELFVASKGKTRRQVEELLATRFPRPDVREQIRRLPVREPQSGAAPALATTHKTPEIAEDPRLPRVDPSVPDVRARARRRELEPLSADRFGVHFTADAELRELIERARALASHRIPKGDLAGLMKLMVASFVNREEQRRFGIGTRPRRAGGEEKPAAREEKPAAREGKPAAREGKPAAREEKPAAGEAMLSVTSDPPTPPGGARVASRAEEAPSHSTAQTPRSGSHGRYLRVQVRREVRVRDGGLCSYVSPDGRRCKAQAFLEFDHVEPFARNGASDTPNLRLLCKAHNLLHARKCFGKRHIAAQIAMGSGGASTPRPR